jgi:hypothetical protein
MEVMMLGANVIGSSYTSQLFSMPHHPYLQLYLLDDYLKCFMTYEDVPPSPSAPPGAYWYFDTNALNEVQAPSPHIF